MFSVDMGDLVELRSWDADIAGSGFKNAAGALTDPTTVTLRVRNPAGTVTVYTYALSQVLKDSAGRFYYRLDPAISGAWTWRFEGTGAVESAIEGQFFARPSRVVAG